MSPAMEASIQQTLERRKRQDAHNKANGIIPRTIIKALPQMGSEADELIAGTATAKDGKRRLVAKKGGRKDGDWASKFNLGAGAWAQTEKKTPIENSKMQLTYDEPDDVKSTLTREQRLDLLSELKSAMKEAAKQLDFEEAARLRDRIFELEQAL
jgi:excinuclease ABC subunit B